MAENWWENDPVAGQQGAPAITQPPGAPAADWASADPVAGSPDRGYWAETNQRAGSLATGINRAGIATALGAPVDASTWLINQGIRGTNALTGSQVAPISRPALGS